MCSRGGRGNDFAAAIGVPLKPEAAIATLLSGNSIRVDLGCCYHSNQQSVVNPNYVARSEMEGGSTKGASMSKPPLIEPQGKIKNYFVTIATCGYDTEVSRRAAKGTPLFAGTASYAYAAVETLFYYEPPFVRLEGDFGIHEGPLLLAATGSQTATVVDFKLFRMRKSTMGFSMSASSSGLLSDGVTADGDTLLGGHVSHPAVSMHQTRTLTIETDTPMLL